MEGIRVAIGQIGRARMVPPRTMKRYEARAASTATERRAIETIHAIYWTFLRDLFKTASALNRHQGCRLRDMQGCTGTIVPTRGGRKQISEGPFMSKLASISAVLGDRKSTRLNSSHYCAARMPSYA